MNKSASCMSRPMLVGLALLSGWAAAGTATPSATQTGVWLALQRSGEQASPGAQSLTELERDKAVARFLKTYDYAIPQAYYGSQFSVDK